MSSGSACWILWLTPMDWLALSIGRSGSQPLEYSKEIEYIENDVLLYDSTKVRGPIKPHKKNYLEAKL